MLKDMITSLLEHGMTQKEISARTGVPQPSISRVYNGVQADIGYSDGKLIEDLYNEVIREEAA